MLRRLFLRRWKHFEFSISFSSGPQVWDILERLAIHEFLRNFIIGESMEGYRINPDEVHTVYIYMQTPVKIK